ncbi:MAG TPA: ethanolamine ammonia-lyase subunit EutC [Chloroflexia bacterium]|nr:ethanolamine ammonia-lyase subunit EutC [Chloroflexia bacterium]
MPEPDESSSSEPTELKASDETELEETEQFVTNPWQALRRFTPARIALGRSGHSLPTHRLLEFQLAHAQARDAVFSPFDPPLLCQELREEGYEAIEVASQAVNRELFLRQPDMGRRLDSKSRQKLEDYATHSGKGYDAVFVLGEGLSAQAVHDNALPVLKLVTPVLIEEGWSIGPVVVARQSRVALGDEIGQVLGAKQVAILIGERPGLSAAASLGIYLTYDPYVGRLEAERNCISNIHPQGSSYSTAASTLLYLMAEARRLKRSGVTLKDERELDE